MVPKLTWFYMNARVVLREAVKMPAQGFWESNAPSLLGISGATCYNTRDILVGRKVSKEMLERKRVEGVTIHRARFINVRLIRHRIHGREAPGSILRVEVEYDYLFLESVCCRDTVLVPCRIEGGFHIEWRAKRMTSGTGVMCLAKMFYSLTFTTLLNIAERLTSSGRVVGFSAWRRLRWVRSYLTPTFDLA
jgi:hypothetical protein